MQFRIFLLILLSFNYSYRHSTQVSFRHLKLHTQSRLTVKKLFVLTYGKRPVSSVFGAKTLNVAVPFSTFSTLNTLEQFAESVHVMISLLIGIDIGVAPDGQQE